MKKAIVICVLMLVPAFSLFAQAKKYPSLLWEITGNGLTKPSYLFGTMHVSSKMVFHLSDSFYYALKSVEEVALEQNPFYWQRDMMQVDEDGQRINSYMRNGANNYLNEKSFQLEKYDDDIRAALTDEPQVVNSLLYRSYQAQEDYEENTYLDLYIYQTGRKLGKKAAGVEDYYQTERIVFEAYQDAMKEKNKKERSTNGESVYDIGKKIQAAYRQGDLDALDSLEKYEYASPAFLEKFLYKRNEIQAHSIDTIVKHNSLFAGVGAAHLPGKRGVIELLRKMGYHLRPVQMQDRNADRKDEIDKMKVPVVFQPVQTSDGFISMQLPGPLYKCSDAGAKSGNESWQYADMENGTYYTVTRVKTDAALLGKSLPDVEQQTDSLLYENIPGKIIKKTVSYQNTYPVIDITNRTRRGDLQRYNIIITPFEEIVCKMSGNEDYVAGKEGETFFNSIHVGYRPQQPQLYTSSSGGFQVLFPQLPYCNINTSGSDNIKRMEWQAVDTASGNAYCVWKKTVNNYRFLEEDTFDLSLIEESIKRSELTDKEISRSFTVQNGYHALNMLFSLQNHNLLSAKAVLRGAHYYLIMAVTKKKDEKATAFLNSFKLTNFTYPVAQPYTDTALHFTVQTPVVPKLDSFLMNMVKASSESRYWQQSQTHNSYMNINKTAFFQNDSTGEAVLVNATVYPKYFYSKDSAAFWEDELNDRQYKDFVVRTKEPYRIDDSCRGYKIVLQDTNTVRRITKLFLLKKNQLFEITALSDTAGKESSFLQTFFSSFRPDNIMQGESPFTDKQQLFFTDYKSKDSLTHNMADDAVADVKFTCKALPQLGKLLASFTYSDKNYFDNKTKFIRELGYINDSACVNQTEKVLQQLYKKTADTALFQNEILTALARLKTASAYDTLQALLLQDPPVFDNDEDYNNFFELLYDSLSLTKRMFPNLLQLSAIESYKKPVNDLLQTLVDSSLVQANDYEPYFSRIYFDAKIEMKKMQNNDERLLQKENNDDEGETSVIQSPYHFSYHSNNTSNELTTYSTLLMPFYNSKPAVPLFFQKQLTSKNPAVQLDAAVALAKYKKPVPDSIWQSLAAKDKYRALLLKDLEDIKRKDLFPKAANSQEAIAKSVLLNDKGEDKFQSLQLVSKHLVTTKADTGYVYFFKYKINKEDDWKIGISGLQPANGKEISNNTEVTKMTDKILSDDKPASEQFEEQLKQLLFSLHESAYSFFLDSRNYNNRNYYFGN